MPSRLQWGVLSVVVLAIGVVPSARALTVGGLDVTSSTAGCPAPAVDPPTRAGEIAAANTYLRSLVTHDTSHLRVAPDVRRIENGGLTADGAQQLCQGNQGPVTIEDNVIDIRRLRWPVVDGDQAIAFYLLDSPSPPTLIAERFKVDHGLINQIEAIFYIDTLGQLVGPQSIPEDPASVTERLFNSDDGPVGFFAPADHQGDVTPPGVASTTSVAAAARAYLKAVTTHRPSAVPLAPRATRTENGRVRGVNAAQIRTEMMAETNQVKGIQHVELFVEGDEAVAMYEMFTPAKDQVGIGSPAVWVATRFRVDHGEITEIESICSGSKLCGERASLSS